MTGESRIPVYLVTGFLGAGKTTLVNRLLTDGLGSGAGLLVNDFGDIVVDGSLVDGHRNESVDGGAPKLEIFEVAGGSIFCTCKTADFALGLKMFARIRPKRLIVEASGMSDPSGFDRLLEDYRLAADFELHRVICLVDAVRTARMLDMLPALRLQIEAADLILLNKADLVDEAALEEFEGRLKEINPRAAPIRTVRADIDFSVLEESGSAHRRGDLVSCNTPANRPGTLQLEPEGIPKASLDAFFHDQLKKTWRVKGWVKADGEWWYLSDNVGNLEWTAAKLPPGTRPSITVITPPQGEETVAEAWRRFTGE